MYELGTKRVWLEIYTGVIRQVTLRALRQMDSSRCGCGWKQSPESWFPSIFRGQRDEKKAAKKQITRPGTVLGAKRKEVELETMIKCVRS